MTSFLQWAHLCRRAQLPTAGHPRDTSRIINYPLENSRGIWRACFFPGLSVNILISVNKKVLVFRKPQGLNSGYWEWEEKGDRRFDSGLGT